MKFGDNWGPTTWIFFHSLAERVNEDSFTKMYPILIKIIKDICGILPCPDCRAHSSSLLQSYRSYDSIITKDDFKNFIFHLHNYVNKHTGKRIENKTILNNYKNYSFRKATADWYNHFTVNIFDVKLIWENKERNKVRTEVLSILEKNIKHFTI